MSDSFSGRVSPRFLRSSLVVPPSLSELSLVPTVSRSPSPYNPRHRKVRYDPTHNMISLESLNKRTREGNEEKQRVVDDYFALKNPMGHQYSYDQNRLLLTQLHGL